MSTGTGIRSGFGAWALLPMLLATAGCDGRADSLRAAAAGGKGARPVESAAMAEPGALRVTNDEARRRRWVLGLDDVRVYDTRTKKLLQRIVLPDWAVARFRCSPGLVLDRSGSALVASNVHPKLWRIDGSTFEVSERAVVLEGKEQWDVGFGPLVLTGTGAVYGLTSERLSLWKIDFAGGRAGLVEMYVPAAVQCAVPAPSVNRFERVNR